MDKAIIEALARLSSLEQKLVKEMTPSQAQWAYEFLTGKEYDMTVSKEGQLLNLLGEYPREEIVVALMQYTLEEFGKGGPLYRNMTSSAADEHTDIKITLCGDPSQMIGLLEEAMGEDLTEGENW